MEATPLSRLARLTPFRFVGVVAIGLHTQDLPPSNTTFRGLTHIRQHRTVVEGDAVTAISSAAPRPAPVGAAKQVRVIRHRKHRHGTRAIETCEREKQREENTHLHTKAKGLPQWLCAFCTQSEPRGGAFCLFPQR